MARVWYSKHWLEVGPSCYSLNCLLALVCTHCTAAVRYTRNAPVTPPLPATGTCIFLPFHPRTQMIHSHTKQAVFYSLSLWFSGSFEERKLINQIDAEQVLLMTLGCAAGKSLNYLWLVHAGRLCRESPDSKEAWISKLFFPSILCSYRDLLPYQSEMA